MKKLKKSLVPVIIIFFMLIGTNIAAEEIDLSGMKREEAVVKIVEILGYQGIAKSYDTQVSPFTDVTTNKGAITLLQQLGMMSGVGEGKFNPAGVITPEQSKAINERVQQTVAKEMPWQHGFYAIASSSQMELIKELDAVSFGWAQVIQDGHTNTWKVSTTTQNANGFKVPQGFEKPMDYAKVNGVETYLMIFFNDSSGNAMRLLSDSLAAEKLIQDMVKLCKGLTQNGVTRSFEGLTIDFEGFIDPALREPYNHFLSKLDKELDKHGKKLNVAVQPSRNFKGYDYKAIGEVADKVILMAHDYEPKKLTSFDKEIGRVYTPITPISEVYKDILACMNPTTGVSDRSKVVLQISFGSAQWQTRDGKIIHDYPYTPSYDKIEARIGQTGTQVGFDLVSGNPYVTYTQDGVTHTIWYEDEKSVRLKTQLIQFLDLGGVSYWRLGTMPKFIRV